MAYSYKAKAKNIRTQNAYMLAKTATMFEYEGLPESIPSKELEKLLQTKGYAFITKVDGVLYALDGTLGGECDAYGNAKEIIISNPWLKFSKTLDVKKDGVLILSDSSRLGLLPIFERGNTFLIENDINMMLWGYNSRNQKMLSASDDRTKQSAETYLNKLVDGELGVIAENAMFDGIKMQGGATTGGVTVNQLIECIQYIKATMYNEIGISSNFNMKRERLISSELDAAEDSLFPLVYNMMHERIEGIEALNEMFGLDVKVDFGSVWALKNKELVDDKVGNNEQGTEGAASDVAGQSGSGEDLGTDPEKEIDLDLDLDKDGERERERGQAQAPDSNPDTDNSPEVDELQAIIDDPESSEEDKQAARELLAEKEQ